MQSILLLDSIADCQSWPILIFYSNTLQSVLNFLPHPELLSHNVSISAHQQCTYSENLTLNIRYTCI